MNKNFKYIFILFLISIIPGCRDNNQKSQASNEVSASDWTIFRGSSELAGLSSDTLSDHPKLLWSFKTEYEIKSSPVIGNDNIYIGSSDGRVYALEVETGKEIWRFDTGDDIEAPPLLYNQTIYIGSLNNEFYALNANSGTVRWKYMTEGEIYGSANILRSTQNDLSLTYLSWSLNLVGRISSI